jgi:hypothetical protein
MALLTVNGEFHLSKLFKSGTLINDIRDRIGSGEGAN